MTFPAKRWNIPTVCFEAKKVLEAELNISPILATLLINRGLDSTDKASVFLSSRLNNLSDPYLMKGMKKAVDRIIKALSNSETIGIYGDYDVDGITAASVLYLFLKSIDADVCVYIPDRLIEGYGVKRKGIVELKDKGAGLIISVDCGISSVGEVNFANSQGIDFIVTDHHEAPGHLPPALSILNPKQPMCEFPFKGLSGVGVTFNLVIALRTALRDNGFFGGKNEPNLREYLDLVALGTLADVVPLHYDNRIFLKYGMKEIEKGGRPGIDALKKISGINGKIDVRGLSFQLIPRINASGRMGDGMLGFQLLTSKDMESAMPLAEKLDNLNTRRQKVQEDIWRDVRKRIDDISGNEMDSVVCLYSEEWHPGVIGIVASRVVDRYNRPAFLIAIKDGKGRGSVRGVEGCNVVECLRESSDLLEGFGGHSLAGGFSIKEENLREFKDKINKALSFFKADGFMPKVMLDAILDFSELSEELIQDIETLAPHGMANPEPVFGIESVTVISDRVVGNDHLSLNLEKNGCYFDAIGFGMGGFLKKIPSYSQSLSLAFTPYIDEWNGGRKIRLKLKNIGEPDVF